MGRGTLRKRFWAKVKKTRRCWLWIGGVGSHGYGQINLGRRGEGTTTVHRVSWKLHKGRFPKRKWVLHRTPICSGNKCCVRPDHLYLGTRSQNAKDKIATGYKPWNERGYHGQLKKKGG